MAGTVRHLGSPTPTHVQSYPKHPPIQGAFERPKPTNTNVLYMRMCVKVYCRPVCAQFDFGFEFSTVTFL